MKIKLCFQFLIIQNKYAKNIFRIMRLSVFSLFVFTFQLLAIGSDAQNAVVKMNSNVVSVAQMINAIEQQTNYLVIYSNHEIDTNRAVQLHNSSNRVSSVLTDAFSGTNIGYAFENDYIILAKKDMLKSTIMKIAQQNDKKIVGTVVDSKGESVVGANVIVKGTTNGTITDENGKFALTGAKKGDLLEISFIGYNTQTVLLSGESSLKIVLTDDTQSLEEVVVIGYGTAKKKDLTGSVKRLSVESMPTTTNTSISQALIGATAGVNTSQSGYAGGDVSLSIRGKNSLSASQTPLLVVDGIIYNGSLTDINANDVATIDILKDASAAAVYGSRSSNGVIIITTKKGKSDKPVVSFNMSMGSETMGNHKAKLMNAEQYVMRLVDYNYQTKLYSWYKTKPTSSTGKPSYPDVSSRESKSVYLRTQEERDNYIAGNDIDWINKSTRTGFPQNYNVSVSGVTDKVNYYISGAFVSDEGILRGDDYQRYTFNSKIDTKITDWFKLGANVNYAFRDYSGLSSNWNYVTRATPLADYDFETKGYHRMEFANESYQIDPISYLLIDNTDNKNNLFFVLDAHLDIPFVKGLSYDFNYSNTWITGKENTFYPSDFYEGRLNSGLAEKYTSEQRTYLFNHIITYQRTFDKHSINATLLYTREKQTGDTTTADAEGFDVELLGYNNLGLGTTFKSNSSAWKETNVGMMGRLNYVYNNRYLLTGTVRRDGYSGFGTNNKYVTLPSLSLAWVASEEDFFPLKNTYMKLRLSYGYNGNQGIGRYASLARLSSGNYNYNDERTVTLYPSAMANENLKWEKTSSWNLGLDFGFLDSRINGSIELYNAKTKDVLVRRTLPAITSYSSVWTNLGGVKNKGIEIDLNTVNVKTKDFVWNSGLTFSMNRDKITDLYGDGTTEDLNNGWFVGKSISAVYDLKTLGVWQEKDLYDGTIYSGWYPGQYKYEDYNKDGVINSSDRHIIGNSAPNCRFSLNNTLKYKNWTLYFLLNSALGGGGYYMGNNGLLHTSFSTDEFVRMNQTYTRHYWTPDNAVNNASSVYYCQSISGGTYQNRGYVRLQDISLTYSFDKALLAKTKFIGDLQLYVSGKNVYTFTGWEGWDPEYTTFPLTRTLQFGLKLSF